MVSLFPEKAAGRLFYFFLFSCFHDERPLEYLHSFILSIIYDFLFDWNSRDEMIEPFSSQCSKKRQFLHPTESSQLPQIIAIFSKAPGIERHLQGFVDILPGNGCKVHTKEAEPSAGAVMPSFLRSLASRMRVMSSGDSAPRPASTRPRLCCAPCGRGSPRRLRKCDRGSLPFGCGCH